MSQPLDRDLDRLFAAYRDSTADVEPSGAYVAGVWRKIEEARPVSAEQGVEQVFARACAAFEDGFESAEPSQAFVSRLWRKIENARPRTTEQQLERLFARARAAFTDEPEPSTNFMPQLWAKIEAARPLDGWLDWVRSWAPRLAGAGALAAGLLIAAVWTQPSRDAVALEAGYVDHLTEGSMDEHDVALWTSADLQRP